MIEKIVRKIYKFILIPFSFKNWLPLVGYAMLFSISKNALKDKFTIARLRSGGKIKIRLNNMLDLGSVMETFVEHVYTPKIIVAANNATIFDIGASIGDFSIFYSYAFSAARCLCYEPTRSAFELCKENIVLNNLEGNVEVFPLAVSGKSGELIIGGDVYRAITISDIFSDNGINKCDLLKMDIEGAEYDVLLNTEESVLKRIGAIAMECHIYNKDAKLHELEQHLIYAGFNVKRTNISAHNICYLYAWR